MKICPVGASIRQEHQQDGTIDVYFRGVLNAPKLGEIGTLSVSADEHQWFGSEDVKIEMEGENYLEVKVYIRRLVSHIKPYKILQA